jgi:hypothetical protein
MGVEDDRHDDRQRGNECHRPREIVVMLHYVLHATIYLLLVRALWQSIGNYFTTSCPSHNPILSRMKLYNGRNRSNLLRLREVVNQLPFRRVDINPPIVSYSRIKLPPHIAHTKLFDAILRSFMPSRLKDTDIPSSLVIMQNSLRRNKGSEIVADCGVFPDDTAKYR